MRLLYVSLLCMISLKAIAATTPTSSHTEQRQWSVLAAVGVDYRAEDSSEGYLEGKNYSHLALGFGYRPYLFIVERDRSVSSTGNSSLNVTSTYSDYLLWAYFRGDAWNIFEPFLGAGLGFYKIDVDSEVTGTTLTNSSEKKWTGGLSMGIRPIFDPLWLSFEVRVRAGEDFNPNPSLSALARLGLYF